MTLFRKDKIVEGKTFENGFAFFTESRKFFYVSNAFEAEPLLQPFKNSGLGRDDDISWIVVPPKVGYSFSERVEVHIARPKSGVIVLLEDEQRREDHTLEAFEQQKQQYAQDG
jgi:hypothetical protein